MVGVSQNNCLYYTLIIINAINSFIFVENNEGYLLTTQNWRNYTNFKCVFDISISYV